MINKLCVAGLGVVLATTSALAADLPSRRAPPVFVPIAPVGYNWTGFEFGLTTTYNFPSNHVNTTPFGGAVAQPSPISLNKSAFDDVGGGVAYNYQFHPGSGVVIGGMADISYFNLHAYEDVFTPIGKINDQERLAYLGTANGRLGYAFDHFLLYAVGGFAFGEVHTSTNIDIGGPAYAGTFNGMKTGYDYGGGIEYAIPTNSILNYLSVEKLLGIDKKLGLDMFDGTIRAEYVHYDLGTDTIAVNSVAGRPGAYVSTFKTEGNLIRVGLGYKFNGGSAPVVARY